MQPIQPVSQCGRISVCTPEKPTFDRQQIVASILTLGIKAGYGAKQPKKTRCEVTGGYVQWRMTLPELPERITSMASSYSSAAKWWVITLETSRPVWSMASILYQVSNILRP